jgi:hypothetical protein
VSPSPPPKAGWVLVNCNEFLTVLSKVGSKLSPKNITLPEANIVNDWAVTFEGAPPPVRYSTVKVVFEGANP